MRPLKIGFAGAAFSNFEARKHHIAEKSVEGLRNIAEREHFDLVEAPRLVENLQDAEAVLSFFTEHPVDLLLIQSSSLHLGDVVPPLLDAADRLGFWIVPEPGWDGELQLNSLTGFNLAVSIFRQTLADSGKKAKWFYGMPGGAHFDYPFSVTLRGLQAAVNLPGSVVGQVGDIVPTFTNLEYDRQSLKDHLGVETVDIGLDELFDLFESVKPEEEKANLEKLLASASKVEVTDRNLRDTARILAAVEALKDHHGLSALAIRCWPEFQERLRMAPCAAVAMLNDTGTPAGCEGDLVGAVSMLAGWYMTGRAPTMNDPVAVDKDVDLIQMWHCGPGPASWADDGQTLAYHHTLNRRIEPGKEPMGVSSDIVFMPGPVTVMRFGRTGEDIYVFEADVVEGPVKPFPGSGGWLGYFRSGGISVGAKDIIETISRRGLEHHYPLFFGHLEDSFREMASWMDLEVMDILRWKPYLQ